MIDNHAVIDYTKCTNCTLCAKVCPTKVIHVYPKKKAPAKPATAAAPKPAVPKAEAAAEAEAAQPSA